MDFRGNPPPVEDRIPCSACGFPCDPKSCPSGGQFTHKSLTTTVGSTTVYYDGNGAQGCPFCGSPAWNNGASLGDMDGWFTRK